VVRGARRIRFRDFAIDGNREALAESKGLPPYDRTFADHFAANGILAQGVEGLDVCGIRFRNIAGFAVLVSGSAGVRIDSISVADSGSRGPKGRNNTTGGVLVEDGSTKFQIVDSVFRNILGNAVWTHSRYQAPRNADGLIRGNRFEEIGRDAVQVGHAVRVRVEFNAGRRIGYPPDAVDVEGGGTPVAIDTAGNVEASAYYANRFEEINGKCIDLDGFHSGEVSANACINRGSARDYPFGHYAIVMNNTNPDMQSEGIRIAANEIDGAKFGGIFVIGWGHRIEGNQMRRLNLAGCNENAAEFGCSHFPGEPDLLQAGIYLGRRAERAAVTRSNRIENNLISGHKMDKRCILGAPGVKLEENTMQQNRCVAEERR
jgi:hypothetical protein